jgi:hypothetical protein
MLCSDFLATGLVRQHARPALPFLASCAVLAFYPKPQTPNPGNGQPAATCPPSDLAAAAALTWLCRGHRLMNHAMPASTSSYMAPCFECLVTQVVRLYILLPGFTHV